MVRFLAALLFTLPLCAAEVSVCDLLADPAAHDREVVELTTFVSHGFEDFTLFDPRCAAGGSRVWVEYGGTFASGTMYCCGVARERSRKAPLVIRGVETTIVEDEKLRRFDKLVQRKPDSIVHATLRGRFFAERAFGHFGLFSLFVIEQVVAVDPQDRRDLDSRASADPPDADCVSREALEYAEILERQRQADAGARVWAFTDPKRVAAERLPGVALRRVSKGPGRVTYRDARKKLWVVVSRPYWLTFFAARRDRVAWVPLVVFDTGC
jgi:hypothetical protein